MLEGVRARVLLLPTLTVLAIVGCSAVLSGRDVSPLDSIRPSPATPTASSSPTSEGLFGPTGPTEIALVTSITDGDTIRVDVLGEESRVRYIGIDTPEMGFAEGPTEPLAEEAATANAALVADQIVVLETDVSETDDFGRLLRYVWLAPDDSFDTETAGWRLANLELVRAGLAEARDYPPDTKYSDLLDAAESEARAAGRGIWAGE
jgi:endonuclease YncB( thermonuclease family)